MKDLIALAPLQKRAWFNLIVFATTATLYSISVPLIAWHFHKTMSSASVPALGVFGLCGILGFSSFICNRRSLDEREELIDRRATMLGMTLFWQVFVLSSMGVWAVFSYIRHQTTVPVGFFPFLVWVGFIVFSVTQSVAILVQYERSASNDAL